MAVFLFGVAVGWVVAFALWFFWFFGLVLSVVLGAFAGTIVIFAILMAQSLPGFLAATGRDVDFSAQNAPQPAPKKAAFKS